jgi:hypothetical protein
MPAPKPYRRPRARRQDPEGDLQREIVGLLRAAGIDFCHVPNSTGRGGARRQGQLKALGVEKGISDLIIFDHPPNRSPWNLDPYRLAAGERVSFWPHMAYLELKAIDRATPVHPWNDKRATVEQRAFLRRRAAAGDAVAVCGPGEAVAQLKAWGYL